MKTNFILYVENQQRSACFYESVLQRSPELNVPGMTEFRLSATTILGLMPTADIKRLLGDCLTDPQLGHGIARAEVYLTVDDPQACHQRALAAGANELSPLLLRNWGDLAAYSQDFDGHVLVFARRQES